MAKRIFKRDMDSYDERNDESTVRELEMLVDGCLMDQGYAIQFWRDMDLYGLREAILYLQRSDCIKLEEFRQVEDFERVFTQKFNGQRIVARASVKLEDEW
jgi:hypothetical protein